MPESLDYKLQVTRCGGVVASIDIPPGIQAIIFEASRINRARSIVLTKHEKRGAYVALMFYTRIEVIKKLFWNWAFAHLAGAEALKNGLIKGRYTTLFGDDWKLYFLVNPGK